jgi:hypothetical protein
MRWEARRLQQELERMAATDPNRGAFSLEQLLSKPGAEWPQRLSLKQGKQVLCEIVPKPGELLEVEGIFTDKLQLHVGLRSVGESLQTLYNGPLRTRGKLIWSTDDGRSGTLPLAFDPGFREAIALATLDAEQWRDSGLIWSVMLLGCALLMLLGIFGLAEPSRARGFTGIPPRRFALPVPTTLLVLHPVLIATAAVVLVYVCWSLLVQWLVVAAGRNLSDSYFVCLLAGGMVWFQALVWGLPAFPKVRIWLVTILVLGVLVLAGFPITAWRSTEVAQWLWLEPHLTWGLAFGWALGVAAAWLGVKLERSGFWSSRIDFRTARTGVEAMRRYPLVPFASPTGAQFWIEWRRNGRLALAIWVPLIWLWAGSIIWSRLVFGG